MKTKKTRGISSHYATAHPHDIRKPGWDDKEQRYYDKDGNEMRMDEDGFPIYTLEQEKEYLKDCKEFSKRLFEAMKR